VNPRADDSAARAIGALIWKDPERFLATAAQLRGTDAVLELRLRGGSMAPAIPAGSMLRIAVGRGGPFAAGEVVAFARADEVCVHRVAWRSGELLVTQGDACRVPDEPIDASRVLGAVTDFMDASAWRAVATTAPREARSRTAAGRGLLRLVVLLAKMDVRLARFAARALQPRGVATP